jgi:cobalt-zinc-cadmium efflux system outer membrane protein
VETSHEGRPPLDLPALWNLAVANNPVLREAAAEVAAARGQWLQAGKYPNPRFAYRESVLGTTQDPNGDLTLEVTQEIVTGGKRRLDLAIARRTTDLAAVALQGRQFEVLLRVRRAYSDWRSWAYTLRVSSDIVTALDEGVRATRRLVEEAKTRPRTDLIRLAAILEEARLTQDRARISVETAWRQLAADVGVPDLPMPEVPPDLEGSPPWDADAVLRRVLAVHTDRRRAALETERARLEVDRAHAEAVPNVTIGSGYSANYPERQHGAILALETPLPLWDRKQGRIQEAEARLVRAQAAEDTAALGLTQETTEALGRYRSARQRVERLMRDILPPLAEGLDAVRRGYQTGAAGVAFADVLLAEQTLGEARLRLAEAWRDLGRAMADLEGLMQLGVGEDPGAGLCVDFADPASKN